VSFVLDNSVVMRWYFGDGSTSDLAYASRVLDSMAAVGVVVPGVWGLEVANVLARAEAQGVATESRTEAFMAMLSRLDIRADRLPPMQALSGSLHLARRYKLSSYDASYLELAMREHLPLATLDVGLRRAAKRAGVKVFAGRSASD
jgi:predicted nucleic acid-binding protein